MTNEKVISLINRQIENSNFERFSQDEVIDEINMCLRDIASYTKLFETKDYIPLTIDKEYLSIPNNMICINRVSYRSVKLDTISQESMDRLYIAWETDSTNDGILEYLVYNNIERDLCRPYPMISAYVYPTDLVVRGDVPSHNATLMYSPTTKGMYLKYTDDTIVEVITFFGSIIPKEVKDDVIIAGPNPGDTPTTVPGNLLDENPLEDAYINTLIYGTAGGLLSHSGRTEDMTKSQRYLQLSGMDTSGYSNIRGDLFINSVSSPRTMRQQDPFMQ